MKNGERQQPREPLSLIRDRFQDEFAALSESHKALEDLEQYPVTLGPGLQQLQCRVRHNVIEKELGES